MAQGVIDNVGKVGDVLMKPIGKVDRFVIKKLFGACQVQIEKNGGAKVGAKENKQAAGELLTKVILETQQNALATERSAAMRSISGGSSRAYFLENTVLSPTVRVTRLFSSGCAVLKYMITFFASQFKSNICGTA